MAHRPTYSYDKEADVLYTLFAPGELPTAAVELHDNILLRFNLTEKRAVGLTLLDFSVSVQTTQLGPRSFPLSGLQDLKPEWQETVIEIITKATSKLDSPRFQLYTVDDRSGPYHLG
jgi:uncharacterized protein YuzE